MGSSLSRGGAEGGGVEHFEPVPSFHDALLIKNNFIRALCRVFLLYTCRIHASADFNCLGARAVARPVILPPYFHPCRGDAHDASLGTGDSEAPHEGTATLRGVITGDDVTGGECFAPEDVLDGDGGSVGTITDGQDSQGGGGGPAGGEQPAAIATTLDQERNVCDEALPVLDSVYEGVGRP